MMGQKYRIADWITLSNVVFGALAVTAAVAGRAAWTPYLILLGALCDYFDGWVARRVSGCSEKGRRLDAMADIVTFGLAPAVLVVSAGSFRPLPVFASLAYVVANVVRHERILGLDDKVLGPTNTSVALVISLLVIQRAGSPAIWAAVLVISAVLLMSERPYPNHHTMHERFLAPHPFLASLGVFGALTGVILLPAARAVVIAGLTVYILSGQLIDFADRRWVASPDAERTRVQ